jgi:hypothetical protein
MIMMKFSGLRRFTLIVIRMTAKRGDYHRRQKRRSGMKTARYLSLELFCALLILTSLLSITPAVRGQKKDSKATRPVVPYPPGPAFTIEGVVGLISQVNRKVLTEDRIIMGLNTRGVDFPPTAETLSRLKSLGASASVLEILLELGEKKFPRPPPVPPPPPPAKVKMLFKCEPGECQVRVGNQPFQMTTKGEFLFEGLDPGRIIVDSQKEGFNPRTDVANLQDAGPGATVPFPVVLMPTEESQHRWGQQVMQDMLGAVRLQAGPRTVTGTLKISGTTPITLELIVHFEARGAATVELQSAAGRGVAMCNPERCVIPTKALLGRLKTQLVGKQLKPEEIEKFVPDLESFLTYEFEEFMATLAELQGGATAMANPVPSAEMHFRIARSTGSYTVQLGEGMKAANIAYYSATGVGTGVRVAYTDYKKTGDMDYPSTTELKFGSDNHSIVFQARTVAHSQASPKPIPPTPK